MNKAQQLLNKFNNKNIKLDEQNVVMLTKLRGKFFAKLAEIGVSNKDALELGDIVKDYCTEFEKQLKNPVEVPQTKDKDGFTSVVLKFPGF